MKNTLIPGVSTHFLWKGFPGSTYSNLTPGRVYEIKWWRRSGYTFLDDEGNGSTWFGQNGVEDYTFQGNLEKILE